MLVNGLFLEAKRCPDGVELWYDDALKLEPGVRTRQWFRYRTDRREPFRLEIVNLENPVVIDFVNAREDTQREGFFSKFGLLHGELLGAEGTPESRESVVEEQEHYQTRLISLGGSDRAKVLAMLSKSRAELEPKFDLATETGAPRMLLKCPYLRTFMTMEIAMAAMQGAKLATCEHCGNVFLTGPLTGRRSHAKYCSARCRVAAARKREATGVNP